MKPTRSDLAIQAIKEIYIREEFYFNELDLESATESILQLEGGDQPADSMIDAIQWMRDGLSQ